jgi:hypothetical protein
MARECFQVTGDAIKGWRFSNDGAVFDRLESMFSEEDFLMFPTERLNAALLDAAQSDHYYTYEKEYDYHEEESEESTDDN